MAPNANHSSSLRNDRIPKSSLPLNTLVAVRNIAHGVNYSIPSTSTIDSLTPASSDCVESCTLSTPSLKRAQSKRNVSDIVVFTSKTFDTTTTEPNQDETHQSVRKSQRQPKPLSQFPRSSPYDEKSRVRYDANLVPLVRKNPTFLQCWRLRDSSAHSASSAIIGHTTNCKRGEADIQGNHQQLISKLNPFDGDETVLWIPSSRVEWEDCISEMSAICKSAALRRHSATGSKPFYAPLSRDYIRDRVDIDDPLLGYQLRHKIGGWMQGFILFTNFTHWSHYFKWDSRHEASGVQAASHSSFKADANGSLSDELEAQERSGDPLAGGVVFPTIAEIGLVGALGCGEYLLRMALDDIRARERYQYIVLQATDASRTFYEKFGFVRVGAISRYGPRVKGKQFVDPQAALSDVVGYRHWTYAHESEKSLGKHGGPSYMMALRVERPAAEERNGQGDSHLEMMLNEAVSEKPKVKQLGASSTPVTKKSLLSFSPMPEIASVPDLSSLGYAPTSGKKVIGRKRSRSSSLSIQPLPNTDSCSEEDASSKSVTKKLHTVSRSSYQFMHQREALLSPPPPGASLSYQQKQYQSVWLAVSPKIESFSRRPPRSRPPVDSIVKSRRTTKKSQLSSRPSPASAEDGDATAKPVDTAATAAANERVLTGQIMASDVVEATVGRHSTRKHDENKENISYLSWKKQKVPSHRNHLPKEQNFFNKVVRLKDAKDAAYFYALRFDTEKMQLEVLPMVQSGVLGGKRNGRPKWKAQVHSKVTLLDANKCEIIPTEMVSKTPFVANESWDIL